MGIFRVTKKTIGRPEGYKYPVGLSFGVTGTTEGVPQANVATNTTGGTQTVVDNETIHTFTDSDAFVWSSSQPGFIDYVVVGGGGGGGGNNGGGGGAGGVLMRERYHLDAGSNCQITIGAGGTGGTGPGPGTTSGGNTTLELPTMNVTAGGGGTGGFYNAVPGGKGHNDGGSGGGGGQATGLSGFSANVSGENRIWTSNGSFSGANGSLAVNPGYHGAGGGAGNNAFGGTGGAGLSVPFLNKIHRRPPCH